MHTSPPELHAVSTPEALAAAVREMGEEPADCLLCRAPGPERYFERFDKLHWRCSECEFVWVHDIYPEFVDGAPREVVLDVFLSNATPTSERKLWPPAFEEFERLRETGRLLEVGCGPGFFLAEAKRRGWQETGVETMEVLAEHARDASGLNVRVGDLAQSAFPEGHFDVVHLNEVIEHVVDPIALLTEMRRVLRPGGMAYLRTGSVESWSSNFRGPDWPYYGFSAGGHIRFYGPRSAQALGRAAGFSEMRTSTSGFAFREGGELKGHWYRPLVRWAQSPLSALAGPCGAGHRLTMRFIKSC